MSKRRRYRLRKRHFLEPLPSTYNSYVSAICESSDNGTHPYGENFLVIADCSHAVALEFYMGTPEARRRSLWKIDGLLDTITSFRTALYMENELIKKASKHKNRKK